MSKLLSKEYTPKKMSHSTSCSVIIEIHNTLPSFAFIRLTKIIMNFNNKHFCGRLNYPTVVYMTLSTPLQPLSYYQSMQKNSPLFLTISKCLTQLCVKKSIFVVILFLLYFSQNQINNSNN